MKTDKQRKAKQRASYVSRGLVRKDIWVYPSKWKAIQKAITAVQGEL